jgi:thymidylate synthase (FAD)
MSNTSERAAAIEEWSKEFPIGPHGYLKLLNVYGDCEFVANVARTSYRGKKQARPWEDLVRYMARHGHTGPFEHVGATFEVKAPLPMIVHLLRHRTGKFNQISGRYTELPNEVYVPHYREIVKTGDKKQGRDERNAAQVDEIWQKEQLAIMENAVAVSMGAYKQLLANGVAPELARFFAPQGIYSVLVCTFDLHNLVRLIGLRTAPNAQAETRIYGDGLRAMVEDLFPVAGAALLKYNVDSIRVTRKQFVYLRRCGGRSLSETGLVFTEPGESSGEVKEFLELLERDFSEEQ